MGTWFDITARQLQPELMDQPGLDPAAHRQALDGLRRVNLLSRTSATLWQPLVNLYWETKRPLRVLDVATGGGDVICRLARRAAQENLPIQFSGCDVSPVAIEYAEQQARRSGVDVEFSVANVLDDDLPAGNDVIASSLFLHHLRADEVVRLLGKMAERAGRMVLINDLRRSSLGRMFAGVGTRLLSRSTIVHTDGPRSVEGAFTIEEIEQLAARAGLAGATVRRCWPQRFLLCWRKA